ncbi:hypothetical protein SAMN03159475_0094 [Pseudomonas sp. NFPP33]|nr:hypothetical protein [Pseudomonas sp. NFPP33]SDA85237.1 hypothetical protein SAMN03159475_0094 [Pseudomonas sp. NFPP33]
MTSKEELRRQLESQVSQHLEQKPDAVTLYAAERKPDRQPWKKRPSLLDQAFNEELARAEREIQRKREDQ